MTGILFGSGAGVAQPVREPGALKVAGRYLVNASGQTIALHGMSLGWSCFHPQYYTPEVVRWLHRDWHCSVVRASLGVEPAGGYLEQPAQQQALIERVVEAAIAEGMYVIIDWHSHNIQLPEALAFFEKMATKYGHYPHVLYELFNEPDAETWAEVKAYSETVIAAIRRIDPDNIIIVGCPHWDQDIHEPARDPIQGFSNLMYSVHFYAATHKAWLRNRADSALQSGLPIFVSESAAMEASGDGPLDYAAWNRYQQWMDDRQLSWVVWSVSDKNETCSVLQAGASVMGGWKRRQLKASGRFTRKRLRQYK